MGTFPTYREMSDNDKDDELAIRESTTKYFGSKLALRLMKKKVLELTVNVNYVIRRREVALYKK